MSAAAGFILLVVATVVVNLLALIPGLSDMFHYLFPYEHIGKSSLSFFLGPAIGYFLYKFLDTDDITDNKKVDELNEWIWRKFYNVHADNLESFLAQKRYDREQVCITLETGKVYVGWVDNAPMRNPRIEYDYSLGITPVASGYRDEDEMVIVNKSHKKIYDQIKEEDKYDENELDVLIPLQKIQTISAWDWLLYRKIRGLNSE